MGMDRRGNRLHYPNMNLIPTYALYGEQDSQQDWLHWETIPARSRLHGFRIAPHRHEHLLQLLSLTGGTARVDLDGTLFELEPGSLVLVPAMVVHGYDFSANVDGVVLTLFESDVRALDFSFDQPAVIAGGTGPMRAAIAGLLHEADNPGERHDLAMRTHLSLLLLSLHRGQRQAVAGETQAGRMRLHAAAFRQSVDRNFRHTRRIADYADEIGVSPTHLNRICRQVLGASALSVIEKRIALEARRQLLFSTLSIQQIGAELGYEDPAYFTRFITRMLGMPPATFRRRMSRA
jgi:AraC family transcriptional activator of pobA